MKRQITHILLSFFGLLCVPGAVASGLSDVLPGARPASMGMAYTAVADDMYGMFYNPAGLAGSGFTQVGSSIGRMISPEGLVSFVAGAYNRPFPILPGSTVGAGFFSIQQGGTEAERNEVLLHFSHSIRLPQIRLSRPLKYGGNIKVRQAVPGREMKVNKVGLGLDAGALYDAGSNWKVGMSVLNLESGVGLPTPNLNLGFVYRLKQRVNLALDVRLRKGLAELTTGVEIDLYQRLLKLRFGKGLALDTQKQVAFGLGVNFSPVIIDINMNIPFKGINHPSGAYQFSLSYKFGAPPFYGRFVGDAARTAEDLRSVILDLGERKKTLDAGVEAAASQNEGLEGQIRAREGRLRDLENKIRQLEFNRDKKVYDQGHPPPPPNPQPVVRPRREPAPKKKPAAQAPAPIRYPRRHQVLPGDTLRRLAEKYYGDPTLWEQIYEANPDKIERGLPIEGAVLRIPVPAKR
ncbi:MAG: hypothetical protein ABIJ96_04715 [Elusimicrobiota bacterium]